MGEIVGLCIGSYEFLSRKNTFGDLLSIFSQDDLTIEEVFDKELDESITRRYFTTTVNNAKMCLDVMGHTTLKAKSLFEYHSIAETAKANNLKPFDYFEYLLTEIPKHAEDKNTDFLTEFLPWSKSLLEHIRKSKKAVEK